jgi:hypothetical protein
MAASSLPTAVELTSTRSYIQQRPADRCRCGSRPGPLGMIAVHIFDTLHADNTPSKTHQVMAGWSPGAIRSWPIWRSSVSGW